MKICKWKRGIALEFAVLFMLVIFLLCTLLMSLSLLGHKQLNLEKMTLLQDVEIDQIGEDYLMSVKENEAFNKTYENYSYQVEGNALTVWRKSDDCGEVVLYVEAELTDEKTFTIHRWRYSLPIRTE